MIKSNICSQAFKQILKKCQQLHLIMVVSLYSNMYFILDILKVN